MAGYRGMIPEGDNAAFIPTPGVANWVLEGVAAKTLKVSEVWWGGEETVSVSMRTRISHDSALGVGARTAITVAKEAKADANPSGFLSSSYATTPPTAEAGVLFGLGWNAHGGVVEWFADAGEEFVLVGAQSLECRAVVGQGASTYGLRWTEA